MGTAFFGPASVHGNVYALDAATGALVWSFATSDAITSSPAVSGGIVYVGSFDNHVYAFAPISSGLRSTSAMVAPNPSTVVIGNTITYTVTVSDTSPGTPSTPTGSVAWSDGGAGGSFSSSGTCTLTSGSCTINYTPAPVAGSVTIRATYGGDSTHSGSSGTSALTQTVNKADTTTVVTSSANPSVFGQSVTFTATVSANAPGAGTPTGTVSFFNGRIPLGASVKELNGDIATISTSFLSVGSNSITAIYAGDSNFNTSTSPALTQTVLTTAQATQNLINTVNAMNLDHGLTTSLDAKLQAAINSFNSNNPTAAKNQLNAFINEVQAQSGKKLTLDQANSLIAQANLIIAAIKAGA